MKRDRIALLVGFVLTLTGCGGGGGGSTDTNNGGAGENSVIASVQNSAPLSSCPSGGIEVDSGIDSNANGSLDASEISSRQYVCNGASGADGLSALVSVTNEPAGVNCSAGGKKISTGVDGNKSGVLDSAEIASNNYICNGQTGTNGLNSFIAATSEPAGANCATGGIKVRSGLDSNSNGTLDSGEVTSTNYVCNGTAGTGGMTWVNVTGTSQQAASNTGYIAGNASQVSITLPASPAVGDIVRVTGAGAGGWKVLPNSGQIIATTGVSNISGVTWTARMTDANRAWKAVASSSDGTKLVAAVDTGYIYTSIDSGATWTARMTDATRKWYSVASSSDGTKLVAVEYLGYLYTSADSGVTWTARMTDAGRSWQSVASSSDGSKLVAVEAASSWTSGYIHTSTDYGATWTTRMTDANRCWQSVASSSDGSKLVATDVYCSGSGGYIYTSTDSGATWTARTTDASVNWGTVLSSSDGTKLVAQLSGGWLYTSIDSGTTWTQRRSGENVFLSADGSKLYVSAGGYRYLSTDFGASWIGRVSDANGLVLPAISSDGTKLVGVKPGGQIYTAELSGAIDGGQYASMELQYIGSNVFAILSHEGTLTYY